jgi:hypothetical protein
MIVGHFVSVAVLAKNSRVTILAKQFSIAAFQGTYS